MFRKSLKAGNTRNSGRARQAESLRKLRGLGVEIGAVIDVGAQRSTQSLIEVFGDRPHLLFEPVAAFHADIEKNYAAIDHRLFAAAAGASDGVARMASAAIGADGVSHAWTDGDADASVEVKQVRVDSAVKQCGIAGPYLLKIDVDSPDATLCVIEGASGVMGEIACIVCELVAMRVIHTAARIESDGFVLWDMVDITYYDDVFYQCDGVFLRRDLVAADQRLKPFDFRAFDPAKWRVL